MYHFSGFWYWNVFVNYLWTRSPEFVIVQCMHCCTNSLTFFSIAFQVNSARNLVSVTAISWETLLQQCTMITIFNINLCVWSAVQILLYIHEIPYCSSMHSLGILVLFPFRHIFDWNVINNLCVHYNVMIQHCKFCHTACRCRCPRDYPVSRSVKTFLGLPIHSVTKLKRDICMAFRCNCTNTYMDPIDFGPIGQIRRAGSYARYRLVMRFGPQKPRSLFANLYECNLYDSKASFSYVVQYSWHFDNFSLSNARGRRLCSCLRLDILAIWLASSF